MTNVALIPARAGSKRLPGKNTKLLGGKPLIAWTIEAAIESGCYGEIIVCTDSPEVLSIAQSYIPDHVVPYGRDPVSDTQQDLEWITEVMELAQAYRVDPHVTFSILRPTSPFRSADTIRRAWEQWRKVKDRVDSLRSVRVVSEHPNKMWEIDPGKLYMDPLGPVGRWNQPTQSLPRVYIQTAGLEIAHTHVLPESISGEIVAQFVLEGAEALDINTPEDWVVAEAYADGRLDPSGQ